MKDEPVRLLVGACGSIGILNLHNYLVHFQGLTRSIHVILTRSACRIIQPATIQAITGNPVFADDLPSALPVPHMHLARWAELVVVIPATANILGKAANGIADDLLSTTILAARLPVLFVPGMNPDMWQHPSVQRNVRTLEQDGHLIVRSRAAHVALEACSGLPVVTQLMPSPAETLEVIEQCLTRQAGRV